MSPQLLSVADALERILSEFRPLEVEEIPLEEADGRVLARDIRAPLDLPPFDNSSMDGYALRAADVAAAGPQNPVALRVAGDLPAGRAPAVQVGPGEAARIMTGAPMPAGADAVVPAEDTDQGRAPRGDDPLPATVRVYRAVEPGAYVRPAGEDVRRGTVALTPRRLRPQDIGFLAMLGLARVPVRRRPRVALLSSGDELLPPGAPIAPGKIYDANSYSLQALIRRFGGQPLWLGRIPDTLEAARFALQRAVDAGADLLVSSAGVSMGAYDFLRIAIEREGALDFWRVNMRPGKPLTFGRYRGAPFLGLPGNPVSAFVSAHVFLRAAIARMSGLEARAPTRSVTLGEAVRSDGRQSYLRARLDASGRARLAGHQGSGNLYGMTRADLLLVIPAGVTELPAGAQVQAMLLE